MFNIQLLRQDHGIDGGKRFILHKSLQEERFRELPHYSALNPFKGFILHT